MWGHAMTAFVYEIASHEPAALDTARLNVLRQSLGDQRCREVIEEVVFHVADRLALLSQAIEADDWMEIERLATRMASLSEQVGLADFARVSRDLCAVISAMDPVAMAAVSARLIRLGEDSLYSVMRYAEQSAL
jgi:hypothetical protein